MLQVKWSVKRIGMLSIVQVVGEGENEKCKNFLLQSAVEIIKSAERFKGKPCDYSNKPNNNSKISVYFSLIFPTEESCNEFMLNLEKGSF